MYRKPADIRLADGRTLAEVLEQHRRWRRGAEGGAGAYLAGAYLADAYLADANLAGADLAGADLAGAYLARANLADANLARANLAGANLAGAVGNMAEVRSAQFERWPLSWVCDREGVQRLQIGCQMHSLEMWERSDPRWIAAIDPAAPEWWARYRDVVLALVKAAPATPYGPAKEASHAR